jgi:protein tyrosine phosphatase (PTP) superfamily phosphohydrolase (DUF442 family)
MPRRYLAYTCIGLYGLAVLLCSCGDEEASAAPLGTPPMAGLRGTAYEAAASVELPKTKPYDAHGLHNVFRLSDRIVTGSEPHGEEALRELAAMGVKTILSVDGKVPDEAAARALGMRYVHVPIQYSGIHPDEVRRIAKTFLDLPSPVYVHCFHGKHRGPAAAAIGRVVLDGVSREAAIAEMRQWGGTSSKYEGLYRTVAQCEMPSARDLAAYEWDYPAAFAFSGFRHSMIGVSRDFEEVEAASKRDWAVDPEHPDVVPANTAERLAKVFADSAATDEVKGKPADFRRWMDDSVKASRDLADALRRHAQGDVAAAKAAQEAFAVVKQRCDDCHKPYRNK